MTTPDTSPPITAAWSVQSDRTLDDLSRLLEVMGDSPSRHALLQGALLQLSGEFQRSVRLVLATGAKGVADAIGGALGARVQRSLTIDALVTKGYASADDLEVDFERIGIDIWGLDFGPEVPGWVQSGWLDDINEIRDAIAQGIDPSEAYGLVDLERVRLYVDMWGTLIAAFEGAVDELIATCRRERDESSDAAPPSLIPCEPPPIGSVVRDRTLIGSGLYTVLHDAGP
ncbi:MAG: hypothetical protein ACR2J9_06560, partial [Gaiellales bacterium]